jgi:hypothetical protein
MEKMLSMACLTSTDSALGDLRQVPIAGSTKALGAMCSTGSIVSPMVRGLAEASEVA